MVKRNDWISNGNFNTVDKERLQNKLSYTKIKHSFHIAVISKK